MTLTTLEAYHVIVGMDGTGRQALFERARNLSGSERFQPHITINKIAALCRKGAPVPDETIDPAWGACALLVDDSCPVYALRPFGCRCMVSIADCRDMGYARIDDYILTFNNLFLQHIEHIDALGGTGSLIDVLVYFDHPAHLTAFQKRMEIDQDAGLAPNHRIPVLMVPPEHRDQVQPLLQKLQHLIPH